MEGSGAKTGAKAPNANIESRNMSIVVPSRRVLAIVAGRSLRRAAGVPMLGLTVFFSAVRMECICGASSRLHFNSISAPKRVIRKSTSMEILRHIVVCAAEGIFEAGGVEAVRIGGGGRERGGGGGDVVEKSAATRERCGPRSSAWVGPLNWPCRCQCRWRPSERLSAAMQWQRFAETTPFDGKAGAWARPRD
nr:hypothetical protein Iba_chr03eCG10890 [Ipomoea batatas]